MTGITCPFCANVSDCSNAFAYHLVNTHALFAEKMLNTLEALVGLDKNAFTQALAFQYDTYWKLEKERQP